MKKYFWTLSSLVLVTLGSNVALGLENSGRFQCGTYDINLDSQRLVISAAAGWGRPYDITSAASTVEPSGIDFSTIEDGIAVPTGTLYEENGAVRFLSATYGNSSECRRTESKGWFSIF